MTVHDRILMHALKANKTIKIDSISQGTCAEYANSGRIFLLEFYFIIIFFSFWARIQQLLSTSKALISYQISQGQGKTESDLGTRLTMSNIFLKKTEGRIIVRINRFSVVVLKSLVSYEI